MSLRTEQQSDANVTWAWDLPTPWMKVPRLDMRTLPHPGRPEVLAFHIHTKRGFWDDAEKHARLELKILCKSKGYPWVEETPALDGRKP